VQNERRIQMQFYNLPAYRTPQLDMEVIVTQRKPGTTVPPALSRRQVVGSVIRYVVLGMHVSATLPLPRETVPEFLVQIKLSSTNPREEGFQTS